MPAGAIEALGLFDAIPTGTTFQCLLVRLRRRCAGAPPWSEALSMPAGAIEAPMPPSPRGSRGRLSMPAGAIEAGPRGPRRGPARRFQCLLVRLRPTTSGGRRGQDRLVLVGLCLGGGCLASSSPGGAITGGGRRLRRIGLARVLRAISSAHPVKEQGAATSQRPYRQADDDGASPVVRRTSARHSIRLRWPCSVPSTIRSW